MVPFSSRSFHIGPVVGISSKLQQIEVPVPMNRVPVARCSVRFSRRGLIPVALGPSASWSRLMMTIISR